MYHKPHQSILILCFLLVTLLPGPVTPELRADQQRNYLNGGQFLAVGTASAAVLGLNYLVYHVDSTRSPLIGSPLPGDSWFAHSLGGGWRRGKTNWLDNSTGSVFTPAVGAIGIFAVNLTWPEQNPWKDAGQDFFLYHSGLWTTKGVTGLFKGIVARPRPFLYYFPDEAVETPNYDPSDARKSFISGHASSAFYSMTYLNKRILAVMRQRLECGDYNNWRWLPPTIGFSWATYVAWTRIHAYKHYFSDIVVGAAVGVALAEFFYWIGERTDYDNNHTANTRTIFKLNFTF